MYKNTEMVILAGNSHPQLAQAICSEQSTINMVDSKVEHFADGECNVSIYSTLRGADVFIFQPTCRFIYTDEKTGKSQIMSVNDAIMELLILIDAAKRASAARITAVIPYFGYARQDRKAKSRDPISAKLMANLIEAAGADRVLTMDLHADQIQGFFDIPTDNLLGNKIFVDSLKDQILGHEDEYIVASPDMGAVKRSRKFADYLRLDMAIVEKRHSLTIANFTEALNIIGNVAGKKVLMLDDMVDTAGSLCNAAKALKDFGALEIYAYATHGLLSGPAIERIDSSSLERLTLLDTLPDVGNKTSGKIEYISTAKPLSEAIWSIHNNRSLAKLFL
ncbi:MAG: ribose-phosphate pyrophosphokinase [Oscillospiraceae bacterium]|jgi:ribose-phosphate pyrophosphokinase|nr:ribose-phosphate pyrophosphokinase [Oscillospiraceae bacterium]